MRAQRGGELRNQHRTELTVENEPKIVCWAYIEELIRRNAAGNQI